MLRFAGCFINMQWIVGLRTKHLNVYFWCRWLQLSWKIYLFPILTWMMLLLSRMVLQWVILSISDIAYICIHFDFVIKFRYPDEEAGHIPIAFVVRKQGSTFTESEVIDFMSKRVWSVISRLMCYLLTNVGCFCSLRCHRWRQSDVLISLIQFLGMLMRRF